MNTPFVNQSSSIYFHIPTLIAGKLRSVASASPGIWGRVPASAAEDSKQTARTLCTATWTLIGAERVDGELLSTDVNEDWQAEQSQVVGRHEGNEALSSRVSSCEEG